MSCTSIGMVAWVFVARNHTSYTVPAITTLPPWPLQTGLIVSRSGNLDSRSKGTIQSVLAADAMWKNKQEAWVGAIEAIKRVQYSNRRLRIVLNKVPYKNILKFLVQLILSQWKFMWILVTIAILLVKCAVPGLVLESPVRKSNGESIRVRNILARIGHVTIKHGIVLKHNC